MKKIILFIAAVAVLAASCKKEEDTPKPADPKPSTPAGPTAPTPNTAGANVAGALISIKMKYSTQPAGSPMPVELETQIGTAIFYNPVGSSTMTDAGTVSVNNINLDKSANNSYTKLATVGMTPSDLGFGSGSSSSSNWNVGGSSSVTAFSYNHTTAFPNYTASLPSSITKSSGISFTINSSTLTGSTDSVIVVIAAGDKSITRTYGANAGTVTISPSDLSSLPTVSDNTAILEVCPYDFREVVQNGKNYIFIKEQAIVRNVNIN